MRYKDRIKHEGCFFIIQSCSKPKSQEGLGLNYLKEHFHAWVYLGDLNNISSSLLLTHTHIQSTIGQ